MTICLRKNPIHTHERFASYRRRVLQKEDENEVPIWPGWLEDAFLDGKSKQPNLNKKDESVTNRGRSSFVNPTDG